MRRSDDRALIVRVLAASPRARFGLLLLFCVVLVLLASPALAQSDLTGLWEASLRSGPDTRGPLIIARDAEDWRAEIAGRVAAASVSGEEIRFELADDSGAFAGRFDRSKSTITGHWIQAGGNEYASPVRLTKAGASLWRGEVLPLDQRARIYLHFTAREDGTYSAFLRNPERNLQRWIRIASAEREETAVRLLAASGKDQQRGEVLLQGTLADGVLSIAIPRANGTYDFHRVEDGAFSDFYPRGKPGGTYVYRPPLPREDGWPVAAVEDVGISREAITRFVQMVIDTPMTATALELHVVLIARHGKLVVEEYFHGEHADKPHDTRSAGKSVASTLIGAAAQAGVPISPSTSVYAAMNGGKLAQDLEPRKKAMTLEHLLTMTSGYWCDDNDPKAPGAEDPMWDQGEERDFHRLALGLPMITDPGSKAVYCSIQPNLAGGVLQRIAAKPLPVLFEQLIAGPLQIQRYHLNLTPTRDAYMGGGMHLMPRDLIKFAQLLMDGGVWNGRRILTQEWARKATSPHTTLGKRGYGYLWWIEDKPYRGRSVRAFMALGNGTQNAIAIPELDLVIGFWGGNYSDPNMNIPTNEYVNDWILAAVSPG